MMEALALGEKNIDLGGRNMFGVLFTVYCTNLILFHVAGGGPLFLGLLYFLARYQVANGYQEMVSFLDGSKANYPTQRFAVQEHKSSKRFQ